MWAFAVSGILTIRRLVRVPKFAVARSIPLGFGSLGYIGVGSVFFVAENRFCAFGYPISRKRERRVRRIPDRHTPMFLTMAYGTGMKRSFTLGSVINVQRRVWSRVQPLADSP
jgi:hypothetical protein